MTLNPTRRPPDGPLRVVYTDVSDLDPAPGIELLRSAGHEVIVLPSGSTAQEISIGTRDAHAVVCGYARISADVMSQAPRLGIVATLSVGTDMVDVNAAEGLGILVRAVPPHATEEVAVHTLALILALERNLPWAWTSARQGEWDPVGYGAPRRLSDLTLGVIGLGRIGRAVIERARPLFGSILGSDPYSPDPDSVSLDTLLRQSDVVSLHLPLSPETHELLDSRRIALLKPGSTIVNVSRGLLINTTALLDALGTGTLRGAALDTTDPEPLPSGHPLRADERVIITPHVAFASTATLREYALSPARAILEWSQAGTHTP